MAVEAALIRQLTAADLLTTIGNPRRKLRSSRNFQQRWAARTVKISLIPSNPSRLQKLGRGILSTGSSRTQPDADATCHVRREAVVARPVVVTDEDEDRCHGASRAVSVKAARSRPVRKRRARTCRCEGASIRCRGCAARSIARGLLHTQPGHKPRRVPPGRSQGIRAGLFRASNHRYLCRSPRSVKTKRGGRR